MSNPEMELIKNRLGKLERDSSILKTKIDKRFDDIEEKQDLILAYIKGDRLGLNKGIQSDLINLIEDSRKFLPLSVERSEGIAFWKESGVSIKELIEYWKANHKNIKGAATLFGNLKVVIALTTIVLPIFYTIFNIILSDWLKPIIHKLIGG